jgi:hypothetical protein
MVKNKSLAIISLALNLVIPGLGSVIGGKTNVGLAQLLLTALAGTFVYLNLPNVLIGIVAVSAWLWALLTSVELFHMQEQ